MDQRQNTTMPLGMSSSTVWSQYQHSTKSMMMVHEVQQADHGRHLESQAILNPVFACFHLKILQLIFLGECPKQWHYQLHLQTPAAGHRENWNHDGSCHVPILPKTPSRKFVVNWLQQNVKYWAHSQLKTTLFPGRPWERGWIKNSLNSFTFVQGAVWRLSTWIICWRQWRKKKLTYIEHQLIG